MGISQHGVRKLLKALRDADNEAGRVDMHEARAKQVADLEAMEAEATANYEAAKGKKSGLAWFRTRLQIKSLIAKELGIVAPPTQQVLVVQLPDAPAAWDHLDRLLDSIEQRRLAGLPPGETIDSTDIEPLVKPA
jgi:hypothetical protein